MKEISLHVLDIAENSINAGADKIKISINEDLKKDELIITISDNGKGMDHDTVSAVSDPFVTSRTTRKVGLGIPFFKAAAESCNGFLKIDSSPKIGTTITTKFQFGHIDRMPLGDIESTFLNLLIGYPKINWILEYEVNNQIFLLDDKVIKDTLGDIPLSEPKVLRYLKNRISSGLGEIGKIENRYLTNSD